MVVLNPRTATALLGIAVASTQAAALPQYGRMRTGTIQHSSSVSRSFILFHHQRLTLVPLFSTPLVIIFVPSTRGPLA
jgi:hypothetical protein